MVNRRAFLQSAALTGVAMPLLGTSTQAQPRTDPLLAQLAREMGATLKAVQTEGPRAKHFERLASHVRLLSATGVDQSASMKQLLRDVTRAGRIRDAALNDSVVPILRAEAAKFGVNLDDPLFSGVLIDFPAADRAHALRTQTLAKVWWTLHEGLTLLSTKLAQQERDGGIVRVQNPGGTWAICNDMKIQLGMIQAAISAMGAAVYLGAVIAPEFMALFAASAALLQLMIALGCY